MKKYQTPEFKTIYFDVKNKLMDGYNNGDVNENEWGDLFADDTSGIE